MKGQFVDKTRKVLDNPDIAARTMREMFSEFKIAKDLIHPSIIEYQYFINTYDKVTKNYEFHIIMEFQQGGDMHDYLREQGRTISIKKLKEIGG